MHQICEHLLHFKQLDVILKHVKAIIDAFLADPAKGPSSTFAILFTISGVLHLWQSRQVGC
jgi:hypothetical protein